MKYTNGTGSLRDDESLPFDPAWSEEPGLSPDHAVPAVPTPQRLLTQVAQVFGVSAADLTGPSRRSYVTAARHAAAYALQMRIPTLSLTDIGTLLGGRDASSICYAIRRARERLGTDAVYAAQVRILIGKRAF